MNLNRRDQEKYMLNTASPEEKEVFQKRSHRYLWINSNSNSKKQEQQEDAFTVVSLDESFFFYDSLVRRVWIEKDKRPIVRVTGSHTTFMYFWCRKHGGKEEAVIQTVRYIQRRYIS